jgi:hypothetical protein
MSKYIMYISVHNAQHILCMYVYTLSTYTMYVCVHNASTVKVVKQTFQEKQVFLEVESCFIIYQSDNTSSVHELGHLLPLV